VKRSAIINDEALHAMGRDIASIHRATDTKGAIVDDFRRHKSAWLLEAVRRAQRRVEKDWADWRKHYRLLAKQKRKGREAR
jgi:hypothetical protein